MLVQCTQEFVILIGSDGLAYRGELPVCILKGKKWAFPKYLCHESFGILLVQWTKMIFQGNLTWICLIWLKLSIFYLFRSYLYSLSVNNLFNSLLKYIHCWSSALLSYRNYILRRLIFWLCHKLQMFLTMLQFVFWQNL